MSSRKSQLIKSQAKQNRILRKENKRLTRFLESLLDAPVTWLWVEDQ